MRAIVTLAGCFSLAIFALSAMAQDRPLMTGTWQLDAAKSDLKTIKPSAATWVIDEGDNSIHIVESETGKSKKLDLQCTTDGKECQVAGDKARASFWYNGPMLVEMETRGDRVTRFRLKVSEDAKTLTVEMTHIVPQMDKIDVMIFNKQPT
jgi:hypothetical protein